MASLSWVMLYCIATELLIVSRGYLDIKLWFTYKQNIDKKGFYFLWSEYNRHLHFFFFFPYRFLTGNELIYSHSIMRYYCYYLSLLLALLAMWCTEINDSWKYVGRHSWSHTHSDGWKPHCKRKSPYQVAFVHIKNCTMHYNLVGEVARR